MKKTLAALTTLLATTAALVGLSASPAAAAPCPSSTVSAAEWSSISLGQTASQVTVATGAVGHIIESTVQPINPLIGRYTWSAQYWYDYCEGATREKRYLEFSAAPGVVGPYVSAIL